MHITFTLRRWLLCAVVLLAPAVGFAQGPAPTLLDDFNRPDNPTVGPGWVESETTPGSAACPSCWPKSPPATP